MTLPIWVEIQKLMAVWMKPCLLLSGRISSLTHPTVIGGKRDWNTRCIWKSKNECPTIVLHKSFDQDE